MIRVAEAERIIMAETKSYGTEVLPFDQAMGRVLAAALEADRDMPPYNRATVDGIAISYAAFAGGIRSFRIQATLAAGDVPMNIAHEDECIEIMTGAAVPATTDTVIRYEDLTTVSDIATVNIAALNKGQNIHYRGSDKKKGATVATENTIIDPPIVSIAATIGQTMLPVRRLPKTVIISTGDELVAVAEQPRPQQIRRSNGHTIKAILRPWGIDAVMLHLPDDAEITNKEIKRCVAEYEVILLTGGVSMGKYDYVPQALADAKVQQLFHKVQQRPGKPMWFGKHANGTLVFAFPGNPVSVFMCMHRYFMPWLQASLGIARKNQPCAALSRDFTFKPELQYFLQVRLNIDEEAKLVAIPVEGNGSGDLANLHDSDAFMELPLEKSNFNKGEVYPVWPYKKTFL